MKNLIDIDTLEDIEISVNRRLLIPMSGLPVPLIEKLKSSFENANPAYQKWKSLRMGAPPDKTIQSWETEGRGRVLSLPRGGYERVVVSLSEHGFMCGVNMKTAFPPAELLEMRRPLWEHQKRLLATLDDEEPFQNLLWRSPQGSGKTQAIIAAFARTPTNALVIVPTENLFEQWCLRVEAELGFKPGQIQGKRREVKRITVAMQQTLGKCADEFAPYFGIVAVDEVQKAAAPTVQYTVDRFPARIRIGVSGDERRSDKKEFLIYEQFGDVACEVEKKELQASGEIVPIEVRIVPTDFRAQWWLDLAPKDRTNERQRINAAREKILHRSRLIDEITENEERNQLALSCAFSALDQHEQVLLLTDRREHCHRVAQLFASRAVKCGVFIGGAEYSDQFTITLAGMVNGELRAAVGTFQAVGVGFEAHRRLTYGVFLGPVAADDDSRMQFNQYIGRFARASEGKKKGVVYYLWDQHVFGLKPVKLINRWNPNTFIVGNQGLVSAKEYISAYKK